MERQLAQARGEYQAEKPPEEVGPFLPSIFNCVDGCLLSSNKLEYHTFLGFIPDLEALPVTRRPLDHTSLTK